MLLGKFTLLVSLLICNDVLLALCGEPRLLVEFTDSTDGGKVSFGSTFPVAADVTTSASGTFAPDLLVCYDFVLEGEENGRLVRCERLIAFPPNLALVDSWLFAGGADGVKTTLRLWVEERREDSSVFQRISNVAEKIIYPFAGRTGPFARGLSLGGLESASSKWGQLLVDPRDSLLGHLVLAYGEYEEGVVQALSAYIRPGDLVLDVGSNVGIHSLALSTLVSPPGMLHKGAVVGFEMQRRLQSIATATAVINGRSQAIHAVWAAVGNETRYLEVRDIGKVEGNLGALRLDDLVEKEKGEEDKKMTMATILQVALDDVLSGNVALSAVEATRARINMRRAGFEHTQLCPSAIKADVEGFELRVLEGAVLTLERCQPVLYLEAHRALPGVRNPTTALLAFLRAWNYSCFWDVKHYVEEPSAFLTEVVPSDLAFVTQNVLCLPSGTPMMPTSSLAKFPVSMDGRESSDDICEPSTMIQGEKLCSGKLLSLEDKLENARAIAAASADVDAIVADKQCFMRYNVEVVADFADFFEFQVVNSGNSMSREETWRRCCLACVSARSRCKHFSSDGKGWCFLKTDGDDIQFATNEALLSGTLK